MKARILSEYCECGGRVICSTSLPGAPPEIREWRRHHQGAGHKPCSQAHANRVLRRQELRKLKGGHHAED